MPPSPSGSKGRVGTDGASPLSPRAANMGCLASRLRGEAEGNLRPEGVGWRRRAARGPRLLAPPGEKCLGPLVASAAPGGRQLRRGKAKAGAFGERSSHPFPAPKTNDPTPNQAQHPSPAHTLSSTASLYLALAPRTQKAHQSRAMPSSSASAVSSSSAGGQPRPALPTPSPAPPPTLPAPGARKGELR